MTSSGVGAEWDRREPRRHRAQDLALLTLAVPAYAALAATGS